MPVATSGVTFAAYVVNGPMAKTPSGSPDRCPHIQVGSVGSFLPWLWQSIQPNDVTNWRPRFTWLTVAVWFGNPDPEVFVVPPQPVIPTEMASDASTAEAVDTINKGDLRKRAVRSDAHRGNLIHCLSSRGCEYQYVGKRTLIMQSATSLTDACRAVNIKMAIKSLSASLLRQANPRGI